MTHAAIKEVVSSSNNLQNARQLALPSREEMLARSPSVQRFWHKNANLLRLAWQEWEQENNHIAATLTDHLLDANLRAAVTTAWENPECENAVKALWEEVFPGVYQCQFYAPEQLATLRNYLNEIADAGIPLRPPYGIALNRHGAMLDIRSEGGLSAPAFQIFYKELMGKYMRPIARMLFPEIVGYDSQTFGFSIQYQSGVDTSLQPHTDASSATLNINLNLPGEEFTGSEVDFFDRATGATKRLKFEAGMAMLHRGNIAHAAQPITSGTRTNMVLWLYGQQMQIPRFGIPGETTSAQQRWSVPTIAADQYAPF